MNIITEEVRMAQHKYETLIEGRISNLEETLNNFIKESRIRQKESENMVWGIKKTYDQTFKTQASSIKKIEIHLGRIAKIIQDRETGSLPSTTETNPRGLANAITTRSGLNYKPPKNPLENITTSQEKLEIKETTSKSGEKGPDNPMKSVESYDHSIPFPGRLKKEKEKEQFINFFKNLQQLSINILFFEALEQMPKYAKFIKDLLAIKGKTEETSKITLNERCFAVLLNKIPLDLGELKPTRICIELANKSTQYPKGIAENVIVKIDKFIFHVDFVVLDIKEDHKILIILGRPFLATAHAMIDVFNKKLSFEVGNETITFDFEKSMKFSTPEDDECLSIDVVDKVVSDLVHEILPSSLLDSFLFEPIDPIRPTLFSTNTFETEKQPPKLKELPSHLEYAFLNNNQEFSVIISSLLTSQEKESLLKVLTQHKVALAWKVADIKGIDPSFCTHKILMEDNFKPVVQPQRRLNPKVQDMVKYEIVKLLDSGLIYAISDSPWVSPVHVVPKRGDNHNNK
ncbi:putative nucleotidyltransferase, ribonuclease H [Tanacetum coccineum]